MPDVFESAHPRRRDRAVGDAAVSPRPAAGGSPAGAGQSLGAARRSAVAVFDHVSKWYGPVIGVNDVTLELPAGITGLVGPNGAGKSTLMKLATGQLRPDLGRVMIQGKHAWSAEAKWHLGYCPESDAFYEEMSGRKFVCNMACLFGFSMAAAAERTERALAQVGMAEQADRRLRGYSKGMRQRIKLAQALVHDPQLLILDEPLNGIDPVGRMGMSRLFMELGAQGKSLLISSHQLDELERLTDRVVVLARGRVVAMGTLAEIRDLLDDYPMTVRIDSDRPRELASVLLGLPDVLGVELNSRGGVVVRAENPTRFFRAINRLALEEDFDIQHLETLDSSAQAILDYLMKEGW